MDNLGWLKEIKKADEDWNKSHDFKIDRVVASDDGNDYRKVKALEIIAEELIKINNRQAGLTEAYKDLVLDVDRLEERIIKMEGGEKNVIS